MCSSRNVILQRTPADVKRNFCFLRLFRLLRRRTQRELAAELGISQTLFSFYETGVREISPARKRLLALTLGVNESDLFPPEDGDD